MIILIFMRRGLKDCRACSEIASTSFSYAATAALLYRAPQSLMLEGPPGVREIFIQSLRDNLLSTSYFFRCDSMFLWCDVSWGPERGSGRRRLPAMPGFREVDVLRLRAACPPVFLREQILVDMSNHFT